MKTAVLQILQLGRSLTKQFQIREVRCSVDCVTLHAAFCSEIV